MQETEDQIIDGLDNTGQVARTACNDSDGIQ